MTKIEAVRVMESRGYGWIANVFFTRTSHRNTKVLKILAALLLKGHYIGSLSFTMPDTLMYCMEKVMTPDEIAAIDVKSVPDMTGTVDVRFSD